MFAANRCGRQRAGLFCHLHTPMPGPVAHTEQILEGVYSPDLIAFWHVPTHYIALIALSRGDTSSDEAQYLHYEWGLVRSGYRSQLQHQRKLWGNNPPYCLCAHLHSVGLLRPGGAYPLDPRARGGSGDAYGRSARVKADLEQAADSLPLLWQATHRVLAVQQRTQTLFTRIGDLRSLRTVPRPQDADREPAFGAYDLAMRRMAQSLGWAP